MIQNLPQANRRKVTGAQLQRLKSWAGRKPCFALMGEFSAGKSTLLNLLLEKNVLPTRVTATQLPPIWISYGTGGIYRVDKSGQRHAVPSNSLEGITVEDTRHIRMFVEAEFLRKFDIIDTPGISDPNMAADVWSGVAGYVNFAVWCTHATQAWRESERGAWMSLPARIRENSLLIVTRADKLRSERDKDKVARRMEAECGKVFSKIQFLSTLDAMAARELGEEAHEIWVESGGEGFLASLDESGARVRAQRLNLLKRYESLGGAGDEIADEAPAQGTVRPVHPVRVTRNAAQGDPEAARRPVRSAVSDDIGDAQLREDEATADKGRAIETDADAEDQLQDLDWVADAADVASDTADAVDDDADEAQADDAHAPGSLDERLSRIRAHSDNAADEDYEDIAEDDLETVADSAENIFSDAVADDLADGRARADAAMIADQDMAQSALAAVVLGWRAHVSRAGDIATVDELLNTIDTFLESLLEDAQLSGQASTLLAGHLGARAAKQEQADREPADHEQAAAEQAAPAAPDAAPKKNWRRL